jgi:hypothetical protein
VGQVRILGQKTSWGMMIQEIDGNSKSVKVFETITAFYNSLTVELCFKMPCWAEVPVL